MSDIKIADNTVSMKIDSDLVVLIFGKIICLLNNPKILGHKTLG